MVDGIGRGGLANEAIRAALARQGDAMAQVRGAFDAVAGAAQSIDPNGARPAAHGGSQAVEEGRFAQAVRESLAGVEARTQSVDELPLDMARGEITDFHEVAAQIKQADLTFKFALEVRNKLIDAYREVMRMSV